MGVPDEVLMGGFGGGGRSDDDAPSQQQETAAEEKKVEKDVFEVKLKGFDSKAKIKIIKEIRAITGLGLKEVFMSNFDIFSLLIWMIGERNGGESSCCYQRRCCQR